MDDIDFNCYFDKKDGLNKEIKDFNRSYLNQNFFQGSAEASLLPFKLDYRKLGSVRKLE
ncbi:MAG: hypothetical protein RLZ13_1359 [Bacteroidota bacterium]|jgi:hypothetical protein